MDLAKAREVKAIFHETYPSLTEWQREIVSENQRARLQRESLCTPDTPLRPGCLHSCDELPYSVVGWEVLALVILYIDQNVLRT